VVSDLHVQMMFRAAQVQIERLPEGIFLDRKQKRIQDKKYSTPSRHSLPLGHSPQSPTIVLPSIAPPPLLTAHPRSPWLAPPPALPQLLPPLAVCSPTSLYCCCGRRLLSHALILAPHPHPTAALSRPCIPTHRRLATIQRPDRTCSGRWPHSSIAPPRHLHPFHQLDCKSEQL
jgi:hypothetical protein